MDFQNPIFGTLIKRYKRFLVDVRLESGEEITAHCANSGAALGITEPGIRIALSHHISPTRKLAYTWEMAFETLSDQWVGANTHNANKIALEGLKNGFFETLRYENIRSEVKYGQNSRIDFLLTTPNEPPCYVEVKNVHYKRDEIALFPDSVTTRGTKHMHELRFMKGQGARCIVLYVIQREDVSSFSWANDMDPDYAQASLEAQNAGVEFMAAICCMSPYKIRLKRCLDQKLHEQKG